MVIVCFIKLPDEIMEHIDDTDMTETTLDGDTADETMLKVKYLLNKIKYKLRSFIRAMSILIRKRMGHTMVSARLKPRQ